MVGKGEEMLTRLEEVWATRLELLAHLHLVYKLLDCGSVVIQAMATLAEGRNIQAAGRETPLHRRSRAHSAA